MASTELTTHSPVFMRSQASKSVIHTPVMMSHGTRTTCQISISKVSDAVSPHRQTVPSGTYTDINASFEIPGCNAACPPCLPVSKGCIKKMAQTRFVNSSPRSYRLMPASVESSDMTSFVEKSSYNRYSPVKFMLEVAELWELSKRSELECNFTLAKSERILGSEYYIKEAKRKSPICHSSIEPACKKRAKFKRRGNIDEEILGAGLGRDLFIRVKDFFKTQELKECYPMGIAGLIKTEFVPSLPTESSEFVAYKMNGDAEKRTNYSLTPLVKRLSVSGLDEVAKSENKGILKISKCERKVKKVQASTKRPNSSKKFENEEEPSQKRPYCNASSRAIGDRELIPG